MAREGILHQKFEKFPQKKPAQKNGPGFKNLNVKTNYFFT